MDICYNLVSWLVSYLVFYLNSSFILRIRKKYIFIFLVGALLFTMVCFVQGPFKTIGLLGVLVGVNYWQTRNIKESISVIMFQYLFLMVIEVIMSLLLFKMGIELNSFSSLIFGVLENILLFIFVRCRSILNFWTAIKKRYSECMVIILFLICIYIYIDMALKHKVINIFMIGIFLLLFSYFLIKKIIERNQLEMLFDSTNKYVEDCERNMERQMINQHEYRNILCCIKNMIDKDKDVIGFIDSVLKDDEKEINYEVLRDVQKIKISSLKAILYHKLLVCREKDIQFVLNVSSNVNYKRINKLNVKVIKDMTIILGILLDNAMEACLETKDKILGIYVYKDKDDMIIQISNTFRGNINIDLLFNKGYTTKGSGHGYGLSLVKRLIKENKNITVNSEICDDVFIQYLKLDISD